MPVYWGEGRCSTKHPPILPSPTPLWEERSNSIKCRVPNIQCQHASRNVVHNRTKYTLCLMMHPAQFTDTLHMYQQLLCPHHSTYIHVHCTHLTISTLFLITGTPYKPFGDSLNNVLKVEENMKLRCSEIQVQTNEITFTLFLPLYLPCCSFLSPCAPTSQPHSQLPPPPPSHNP